MKVEIQKSWFSTTECEENKNKLYVFGDNMIRRGNGGQATIRDCTNSIGLATKRLPSMYEDSFFADREDEFRIVEEDIERLLQIFNEGDYDILVLPADGLGTGLSKMPEKSPNLFKYLNKSLEQKLNIEYQFENT